MRLTPQEWRLRGHVVALPDARVFAVDLAAQGAAPQERTALLALHGFPTSSWDWAEAASLLSASGRRVVLFDGLGFGLTETSPDAACSVFDQADAAIAVLRAAGVVRAHIWAHDMGTSVATELLARREQGLLPFEVASVVLMNGGLYVEMSRPAVGQRLLMSRVGPWCARLARRGIFAAQLRRVFGRPPDPSVIDGMWNLVARDGGTRRLPTTIRFMGDRARFRRRWIGALERSGLPVLIAWGGKDPVTRLDIGRRLAREIPGAELRTWDDLGHYPHVEDAVRVERDVSAFLNRVDDVRASSPSYRFS